MTYRNRPNNARQSHTVSVYFVSMPLGGRSPGSSSAI